MFFQLLKRGRCFSFDFCSSQVASQPSRRTLHMSKTKIMESCDEADSHRREAPPNSSRVEEYGRQHQHGASDDKSPEQANTQHWGCSVAENVCVCSITNSSRDAADGSLSSWKSAAVMSVHLPHKRSTLGEYELTLRRFQCASECASVWIYQSTDMLVYRCRNQRQASMP